MNGTDIAALFISILALLFTFYSFYWMNWRRGKLIISKPKSFAATSQGENNLLYVELPLVFYNSGALAYIIQNLRIKLKQGKKESAIVYFNNTVANLASCDDGSEWGRQFAVEPRSSYSSIFVFVRNPGRFVFSPGKVMVTLDGILYNEDKWRTLITFELHTPDEVIKTLNSKTLLPYDNDPEHEYNA